MTFSKKTLLVLTILSSNILLPLRGRWAAAGVGYAAGKSSGKASSPDKATNQQIKRHETNIKQHQKEIEKINKNKTMSSSEKQTAIKSHQSEIQKIEGYINELL